MLNISPALAEKENHSRRWCVEYYYGPTRVIQI